MLKVEYDEVAGAIRSHVLSHFAARTPTKPV